MYETSETLQLDSLRAVGTMIESNGGTWIQEGDLDKVSTYLNGGKK